MFVNGIEIDIANLEKPLLLVSEEDELLFQRLLQPTIEHQLIQCQLALSTRKSISLVKDVWLAMYRDRENLYINSGHAMLYPIRLILFELVTQAEYFQRLAKKSRGDECLSFMYAVILLQFVLQWLKERFRDNREVYSTLRLLYRVSDDEVRQEPCFETREQKVAQAVAVKAIRFEVREHTQEFTSLLSQSYKLIAFLHSKLRDEGGEAAILPSLRNIAETLNRFYKDRYTTHNPSFTG
ncbi:hypothetical protein I6G82_04155 [Lysinibacillus macroides]|uniref:Uncharacterized protein n=1 Tax=Lysinibacillus macroides TaxID=33935 RepID=A0A0M9DIG0_9BACI|nr:hypothetical protein [Lysinibacillus macroides]KOY81020.1 hypothetical protein ADM90_17825 [Lysinibacillus macroides]QPR68832.1 hypothetical protein I6G82_04155 [Lysinibacillus macroides]